ncbi:Spy/CpxP family protein refolding chaperone [Halomonas sp. LR3S48]|uniref:Spy/CpxP family protein refolding chaperone n=1 Tax=Halomonadaceae TaxID=28256 RepID=UPI0021E36432|nr:Spy/CpxP family protein refolding chaperone [Halomonas sp. LR3S48]UYG05525.1 Spy/CpxP family protein refolding chaperone [Halomonas sp. LR3S48]
MTRLLTLTLLLLATGAAHGEGGGHGSYAEFHSREIKALAASDVEGLRLGRGMELALPAELNGYPGPLHVLELADELELTEEQQEKTEQAYERMRTRAGDLGEQVIESERELDRLFAERRATLEEIERLTEQAARLWGRLRAVHLEYHLHMLTVLDDEQVRRYSHLRSYGSGGHRH